MHIFSGKDNKPVFATILYYGVIEIIWELDCTMFHVSLFRCKWVKNDNGIKVDELGFILVDLNKEGQKKDTFILASQAKQVFYITYPANKKWSIIFSMKSKNTPDWDNMNDIDDNINDILSFSLELTRRENNDGDDRNDNVEDNKLYKREDHFERISVQKSYKKQKI